MRKQRALVLASVLAMLAGAVSVPAWAQQGGSPPAASQGTTTAPSTPPGPPQGTARGWGMGMMRMTMMCQNADARLAGELAYQEVRLGITDAQRPAWRKMADAVKTAHEPVRKFCAKYASQPMPTALPERLQRMEEMSSAHAAAMRDALPAITQMYNQLSTDQKKLADQTLMVGPGMRGFGMHGSGMGRNGMGMRGCY